MLQAMSVMLQQDQPPESPNQIDWSVERLVAIVFDLVVMAKVDQSPRRRLQDDLRTTRK